MDRECIDWTDDETMTFVSQAMSIETDQDPTSIETSYGVHENNSVQAIHAPAEENVNVELETHYKQDTNDIEENSTKTETDQLTHSMKTTQHEKPHSTKAKKQ